MKKPGGLILNIVLFTLLLIIIIVLALCIKGEWTLSGYVYSDEIKDVIRVLSLFEVFVSIILRILNRNKHTLAVLLVSNAFVLYKFLSTFCGF